LVGSFVSGGSPVSIRVFIATAPWIDSERLSAASPIVTRSGTPKPNELARGSARGGRGAGGAACCADGPGKPVRASGGRACSGDFGCAAGALLAVPLTAVDVLLLEALLDVAAAGKAFTGALNAARAFCSAESFFTD
jgi:hypothetical protein